MAEMRMRGRPKSFHDKTEQNTIQSLDRAMGILAAVADGHGLTLTELAQRTAQSPATVYRVLSTLRAHNLVEVEAAGQLWHVGAEAWRIGSAFLRRTHVADRARAAMQDLMRATGETANLGVESHDEVLFLTQVETKEAIRAFFPPGTKNPMHVSGIGKALLAWYPEDRVRRIVSKTGMQGFTPGSLTDVAALLQDLVAIRERGYAIDDQERAIGMRCIAAPIFNAHAEPIAGLSISGPAFRIELGDAARIGAMVQAAADDVTAATGGKKPDDLRRATRGCECNAGAVDL